MILIEREPFTERMDIGFTEGELFFGKVSTQEIFFEILRVAIVGYNPGLQ